MIRTREETEALEERILAPYAMRSGRTRGRVHPEPSPLFRTQYQRDRDRIIHSTAFRRLEYKTQVFVNHEGDHYRTRLTHTMEVAQIARTIARILRANEDLVEAIALSHDLGHTPFGHAGEEALRDLMAGHGGFEHNLHGLRVVDHLERQYLEFPGLNLTYEVREAIAKHATRYDRPPAAEFRPDLRPTLEAQIVEVADAIAYTSHDLDDGLLSGILDGRELLHVRLPARAWRRATGGAFGGPGGGADGLQPSFAEKRHRRQLVRHVIDLIVTDLVRATATRLADLKCADPEDIRVAPDRVVVFSEEVGAEQEELQSCLMEKFYRHYRLVRMARKARRLLTELFEAFLDEPRQLPPEYQERLDLGESVHQVICDYIAGMTDRYAHLEHQRLFGPLERA